MPHTMARLLLAPGWAMPADLFDRLRPLLPAFELRLHDPRAPAGAGWIGVGHSLGLMRLLLDPLLHLDGLVSINGFTRFAAAPDHPHGVAPRLVERMQRRLQRDPGATVAAFRQRCGLDPAAWSARDAGATPDDLRAGLELLRHGDARAAWRGLACPALALAGDDDPIAPPALSAACFGTPRRIAGGGHLLPLSHPQACADAIRALAARAGAHVEARAGARTGDGLVQ